MLLKRNQSYARLVLQDASVFSRSGWRDELRSELEKHIFLEPHGVPEAVQSGFVDPWHLSTVTFDDMTRWLIGSYIVLGYRIDRRSIPSNLFNAELQKKIAAWCAEHEVERCPNAVRSEFKEILKDEWMRRTLPKVKHLQIAMDTTTGILRLFGTSADADMDLIRRAVYRILGVRAYPLGSLPTEGRQLTAREALLERAVTLGPIRPMSSSDEEAS